MSFVVAAGPTRVARGTFDVTLKPLPAYDTAAGPKAGRMSIDKVFHGDLSGTSVGEMLAAMTSVKDSAGYVAIERVSGTLDGRRGSFVLQHSATMDRGAQRLSISVVPDSGTDELVDLSGTMTIAIAADGTHSYEFTYTLGR
jgi:hypothetical protein